MGFNNETDLENYGKEEDSNDKAVESGAESTDGRCVEGVCYKKAGDTEGNAQETGENCPHDEDLCAGNGGCIYG